jgi:hypothetical protein
MQPIHALVQRITIGKIHARLESPAHLDPTQSVGFFLQRILPGKGFPQSGFNQAGHCATAFGGLFF